MAVNYLTIIVSFIILLTMAGTASLVPQPQIQKTAKTQLMEQSIKYLGMWVTADGYIRQELLPNGRYDEARGTKKSAYTGRYEVSGDHIKYRDDTGFTATGDFKGNILYHGGYIFYREVPTNEKKQLIPDTYQL